MRKRRACNVPGLTGGQPASASAYMWVRVCARAHVHSLSVALPTQWYTHEPAMRFESRSSISCTSTTCTSTTTSRRSSGTDMPCRRNHRCAGTSVRSAIAPLLQRLCAVVIPLFPGLCTTPHRGRLRRAVPAAEDRGQRSMTRAMQQRIRSAAATRGPSTVQAFREAHHAHDGLAPARHDAGCVHTSDHPRGCSLTAAPACCLLRGLGHSWYPVRSGRVNSASCTPRRGDIMGRSAV